MNRLLLLRHAKSSWDVPGLPDYERPLAPRGERAVAALRLHVEEAELAPDLVLCSTARRAIETWEGIAAGFPPSTTVEFANELYGATARELRQLVQQLPSDVECVLLVGHNPGFEDLAEGMVGSGDADLRERLEAKFPTGALVTLLVRAPWADLQWGSAELSDFVVPRDLDD